MYFLFFNLINIFVNSSSVCNVFIIIMMFFKFSFMVLNFFSINCQSIWFFVFSVVCILIVLVIFSDDSVIFSNAIVFLFTGCLRRRLFLFVFFFTVRLRAVTGLLFIFIFFIFISLIFLSVVINW